MPDMPGMDGKKDGASGGAASADVGIDKVLKAARAEGLSNPVEIGLPTDSGSAYVVKQVQRSWPEKQDAVAVDPGTGKVTDVSRFADYPVLAKLTRYGIDLHTGTLFGIVNQIALAALALALIFLIVLGLPDVVAAPPHPRPRPVLRTSPSAWRVAADSAARTDPARARRRGGGLGGAAARHLARRVPGRGHPARCDRASARPCPGGLTASAGGCRRGAGGPVHAADPWRYQ